LIEEPKRDMDLSTAQRFGDVEVIFPEGQRRASIFATEDFLSQLVTELRRRDYDPNLDYIVAAGSVAAVTLAIGEIASLYGSIQVLIFNSARGEDGQYISRTIGVST
jgi:hypothetical protein